MTEHSVVFFVSIAIVAAMAILIYAVNRISDVGRTYIAGCGQIAAITAAYEVRKTLDRILANSHEIDRSIKDQRRVLNDAHRQISAVTKGVKKPAS